MHPTGPPESMREHVVAAAHAMRKGDWKACRDFILAIKVNKFAAYKFKHVVHILY